MLTALRIRNFKLFEDVSIDLGERVVLIGPNNSGKSSALQALSLWDAGVKRWIEKRGGGKIPKKRRGVTINRRDLLFVPVPSAKLLWKGLHTHRGSGGESETIDIEVTVEGVTKAKAWTAGLSFYYANEESFYCRPLPATEKGEVPSEAGKVRIVYLPPMSGLASSETLLVEGRINVLLGQGRTAEVLRNLCYQVFQKDPKTWERVVGRIESLFGVRLNAPEFKQDVGEIDLTYRTRDDIPLDIFAGGRGQQQTLLLLTHMMANPGAVLLLDEPDAHLEFLRQRQIYQVLAETASETGCQIIAASHSEVVLNEAADRDVVVAFVGRPHRIDERGSQVVKALKEIGFEHYVQAEETGWVLYLEGSTDLAVLKAFAERLGHPARAALERPFVHYVGNQPSKAQSHFYGLREAKPDLVGLAIYDRLPQGIPNDPNLRQAMWGRREIENYLCQRETLLALAETKGKEQQGALFGGAWRTSMEESISEIETALTALKKPSPWEGEIKASDDFLDPLFEKFYERLRLPNLMTKTNYHTLAPFVPVNEIDAEVREKLDLIAKAAQDARPRAGLPP